MSHAGAKRSAPSKKPSEEPPRRKQPRSSSLPKDLVPENTVAFIVDNKCGKCKRHKTKLVKGCRRCPNGKKRCKKCAKARRCALCRKDLCCLFGEMHKCILNKYKAKKDPKGASAEPRVFGDTKRLVCEKDLVTCHRCAATFCKECPEYKRANGVDDWDEESGFYWCAACVACSCGYRDCAPNIRECDWCGGRYHSFECSDDKYCVCELTFHNQECYDSHVADKDTKCKGEDGDAEEEEEEDSEDE